MFYNIKIMKDVFQEVKKNISAGCYVLAVSGGIDSICLADICFRLKKENSTYNFLVVHVEHGLRGKESQRDADFVSEFCKINNLEYVVKHVDVPKRVAQTGESIEEAARKLRYEVLFDEAKRINSQRILTAHHANDQAETVLLRLVRGSGGKGLGAMHQDTGKILRPLLDCSREEIENYCQERKLQWVNDSTNDDIEFSRNFVRKKIFPCLEKLNPNFVGVICQTAIHLQNDEKILDNMSENILINLLENDKLKTKNWQNLFPAIRTRILQKWLIKFGCTVNATHIEALDKLILNGTSKKELALPGLTIEYAYHKLYVEKNKQHIRQ